MPAAEGCYPVFNDVDSWYMASLIITLVLQPLLPLFNNLKMVIFLNNYKKVKQPDAT
jgi:hypothetical protein